MVIALILTDALPELERVTGTVVLELPTEIEPKSNVLGTIDKLPIRFNCPVPDSATVVVKSIPSSDPEKVN